MNAKHYITLALSTALTVGPQFVTTLPPAYRDVATAVLGLASAYYHLLQDSPAVGGAK